ncbi:sensor histidine kinase [Singulisphaera acidiphila]|uniref:histidine kinase n=1 Tax=Singulisphaera acidiphila (strain ATCC BAA-1392 / DSM 18658 / VKM B-2454 / MOB10) TaxID=886293 RepID=L0DEB7_SINAD|nr:ATP-binding protein [Singulisphaera acidiphila]AGA27168.1 PAS domain S-box [Singulisphaera acidiphila DSM 18658]
MPAQSQRKPAYSQDQWGAALILGLLWVGFGTASYVILGYPRSLPILVLGALMLLIAGRVQSDSERKRWAAPIHQLARELNAIADDPQRPFELTYVPELGEVLRALRELKKVWHPIPKSDPPSSLNLTLSSGEFSSQQLTDSLTRSALLASLTPGVDSLDVSLSGDFSTTDMVSRLESRTFRWIESSAAEQEFLGWELKQLREMSFLEIVHPDDYERARDELRAAISKGEVHGLVLRIKTARGKPKAIEMNVGARYGPDLTVSHLRCHITDVTAKIRAERELRLRTRELTQVNEQLRHINRELEELKDRYSDLYQNAPAMYFSLDDQGRILECNDTLLRTLGYRRDEIISQSYERLLPEWRRSIFAARFADFRLNGKVEIESQWVMANAETIDVWVSGTTVIGLGGKLLHTRIVAQDVTARHRLEAELQEKNDRLAVTIDELSRKNKEMDEFTYVVSHDLQEPLRTLIAFSDFLLRDCGDKLDSNGQEYVRYLVDASRRMRALIHGLLTLSRAGRVTGDFTTVNLEEVMSFIKADLGELIRSKGAEVRTTAPLPTLWGDRDRISQLLANLISNGLKYNQSAAPWVEVGTLDDEPGPWLTVYVRDNGIGIDPQFHTKIFQLFRRLHTREEYEGTGAGLAICSKIVHAHGGRIWIESEPNQGATFFISLRRSPPESSMPQTEVTHAT